MRPTVFFTGDYLLLVTKSDNLGASWPQGFFLRVKHGNDVKVSNHIFFNTQVHISSTVNIFPVLFLTKTWSLNFCIC